MHAYLHMCINVYVHSVHVCMLMNYFSHRFVLVFAVYIGLGPVVVSVEAPPHRDKKFRVILRTKLGEERFILPVCFDKEWFCVVLFFLGNPSFLLWFFFY